MKVKIRAVDKSVKSGDALLIKPTVGNKPESLYIVCLNHFHNYALYDVQENIVRGDYSSVEGVLRYAKAIGKIETIIKADNLSLIANR